MLNRKNYNLTNENLKLLKFVKKNEILATNEIAGKPKNMFIEMLKRYFKNPYVVIATIVFTGVIIASVVINKTSVNYHPENGLLKPAKSPFLINDSVTIRSLPPQATPHISEILSNDSIKSIILRGVAEDSEALNHYLNFHYTIGTDGKPIGDIIQVGTDNSPSFKYTYDAYKYHNIRLVIEQAQNDGIIKSFTDLFSSISTSGKKIPPKVVLTQEYVSKVYDQLPSITSILGTDSVGNDIWTRTWAGTWESIQLALIVATIETVIGVAIGAWLGFHAGKKVDTIVMRILEIITSPPSLIWFIMLVSIMGTTNTSLAIALIVTGWVGPVGGTRMFIITVKDEEYITASKSLGASTSRQVFVHALPAVIGKISYSYVQRIPSVILSVSSLAFLGFFKDDSSSNLGKLLIDAVPDAPLNAWILILPSLILVSISLSLHFIALGVHDALDPKVIRAK